MSPVLPRAIFVGRARSTVCWYRCALPAMALGVEWLGVAGEPPDLAVGTGVAERTVSYADLFDYEVVVLQMPATTEWHQAIRDLRAAGVTVLVEMDDYVHAVGAMADHELRGDFGQDAVERYEVSMRLADGIIVSTDYLAERYRAFNPRVWVCRNGLDLKRYDLTLPSRDHVAIGWAGGTGHREALWPWLRPVGQVMRERPATRFVTVGQPWALALEDHFGPERTLAVPFSQLESYPAAMTLFDIALAPAGKGGFFRGKSDLRWLEASALGVPVIADPAVYPEIEHGVTGFHASTPAQVRKLLATLVDDPDLRARVGANARAHVREHRSAQAMAPQWATAITEAVRDRAALAA